jgi:phosphopantetheinyl transferase (holo-ACP synthase)
MTDWKATKTFLSDKDHPYFTFYTKAETTIKALIMHLPNKNSSEDITVARQELGYEVISFKQMTAQRPSPE